MMNFNHHAPGFSWAVPVSLDPERLQPAWKWRYRSNGAVKDIFVIDGRAYVRNTDARDPGFDCIDLKNGRTAWGFRASDIYDRLDRVHDEVSLWFDEGRVLCLVREEQSRVVEFDPSGRPKVILERNGVVYGAKLPGLLVLSTSEGLEFLDDKSLAPIRVFDLPTGPDGDRWPANRSLFIAEGMSGDLSFNWVFRWNETPSILRSFEYPLSHAVVDFCDGVTTDRWLVAKERLGAFAPRVHVYDAESIQLRHVFDVGDDAGVNVIVDGDMLYVRPWSQVANELVGSLKAYDLASGNLVWQVPAGSFGYMVATNDWIFRGGDRGLVAHRRTDGKPVSLPFSQCKEPVFIAIVKGLLLCSAGRDKEVWCFVES